MIASEHLGPTVLGIFIVGIVAAAFSSADSALTSLTTSFCVDILGMKSSNGSVELEKTNTRTRRITHVIISVVFIAIIMIIHAIGSDSIINAIYRMASYTYGPLLGLYIAGLYTQLKPMDKLVPYITIAAPILCFVLELVMMNVYNYKMGYEMLLINGGLTVLGLWLISLRSNGKDRLIA
jgi:Na+/proline symporter